jgi:hypothetical protein
MQSVIEAGHPFTYNAGVKNKYTYTLHSPHNFMAFAKRILR